MNVRVEATGLSKGHVTHETLVQFVVSVNMSVSEKIDGMTKCPVARVTLVHAVVLVSSSVMRQ